MTTRGQFNVSTQKSRLRIQSSEIPSKNMPTTTFRELMQNMTQPDVQLSPQSVVNYALIVGKTTKFHNTNLVKELRLLYNYLLIYIQKFILKMNSQDATSCIWSLGESVKVNKFDDQQQQFFGEVFEQLIDVVIQEQSVQFSLSKKQIMIILNSMGQNKWQNEFQVCSILKFAQKFDDFSRPEICDIIEMIQFFPCQKEVEIIRYFFNLAKIHLKKMLPQQFTAILFAMRKLCFFDKQILNLIEKIILEDGWKFSQNDVVQISLIYADFGGFKSNLEIFEKLTENYLKNTQYKNKKEFFRIGSLIYAFSILKSPVKYPLKIMKLFFQEKNVVFSELLMGQLYHFRRAQLNYLSQNIHLKFPNQLQKLCIETLLQKKDQKPGCQTENIDKIFNILLKYDKKFNEINRSVLICSGELEIMVEIVHGYERLAIQVLPADNFTITQPVTLMGCPRAELQLFSGLGWKVIVISEKELQKENFEELLMKRVASALI